jgi:hypothetical protein
MPTDQSVQEVVERLRLYADYFVPTDDDATEKACALFRQAAALLTSQAEELHRLETEVLNAAMSDRLDMDAGGSPLMWKEVAERAEQERDEALRECARWASEAGEAKGRLEMSEAAGIVDGWRERAEAAESELQRVKAERDKARRVAEHLRTRAQAAEARSTRPEGLLEEAVKGLEEIVNSTPATQETSLAAEMGEIARSTLSTIRASEPPPPAAEA